MQSESAPAEGIEAFPAPSEAQLEAQRKRVAKNHDACERSIDTMLGSNLYIKHMIASLNERGCSVTRSFFKCAECPEDMLIGGFWSNKYGVVLCQNRPRSPYQMGRTMIHELVHAYDDCRVDFNMNNCLHIACTEIRAANLSGDCTLAMELLRGRGLSITAHKQECVKRIAITSLSMNSNCKDHAARSVDVAWKHCWPDLQPFDHIP